MVYQEAATRLLVSRVNPQYEHPSHAKEITLKSLIRRWAVVVATLGACWTAAGAPIYGYF